MTWFTVVDDLSNAVLCSKQEILNLIFSRIEGDSYYIDVPDCPNKVAIATILEGDFSVVWLKKNSDNSWCVNQEDLSYP